MRRKPWPIILLALLYLIFPVLNILVAYIRLDFPLGLLLENLFFNPENRLTLFNIFVPSTVAAYAIYKVRKWSFPVVLICILWLSGNMIKEFSSSLSLGTIMIGIVIPIIINIALASYILIPNVYIIYRDSMLRWWERDKRFVYRAPCEIHHDDKELSGEVINISKGGCFLETSEEIPENAVFTIKFSVSSELFSLKVKIGHRRNGDLWGYGLQFVDLNPLEKKQLERSMHQLHVLNTPEVNPIPHWKEDFQNWFRELIRTGKGITPNTPENYKPKK
jgi:PilZ domain